MGIFNGKKAKYGFLFNNSYFTFNLFKAEFLSQNIYADLDSIQQEIKKGNIAYIRSGTSQRKTTNDLKKPFFAL